MRVVFMGTPDFSVPSLRALVRAGHNVPLVVTRPDRPRGRGLTLEPSPVKAAALELGLQIHQPEKPNREESVLRIEEARPEALIVVAYGAILKQNLLGMGPRGAINVHASLLPKYRGMSPIQRAIWDGEPVTGITTMFMDEGVDTGDMILSEPVAIGPDETAGELHDRLSEVGARLLVETLGRIEAGTAPRIAQSGEASYAPRLEKKHGFIDWSLDAQVVHNRIRALTPWPGATAFHDGSPVLILRTRVFSPGAPSPGPGAVKDTSRGRDRAVGEKNPSAAHPRTVTPAQSVPRDNHGWSRPGDSQRQPGQTLPGDIHRRSMPGESAPGESAGAAPGTIVAVTGDAVRVACGAGAVDLLLVRPAGRATMTGADFARGRRLEAGRDSFDLRTGKAS